MRAALAVCPRCLESDTLASTHPPLMMGCPLLPCVAVHRKDP